MYKKQNDNIEIVIMCGGKGTRLASALPLYLPKCLAPIDGRPFLDILVKKIQSEFPESPITLAAGHNADAIDAYLSDINRIEWHKRQVTMLRDNVLNGTAQCAYWITTRSQSASTIFVNGDTWQEESIAPVLSVHSKDWQGPMTAYVTSNGEPRGVFVLTKRQIANHKDLFHGRNLDARFLMDIQKNVGSVKFCFSDAPFYDIGTPERLEEFRAFWKERISQLSSQKPRTASRGSAEERTTRPTS